jgi:hypothetical protein
MQLERSFEMYSSSSKKDAHTKALERERRNYFLSWCSANERNIYISCVDETLCIFFFCRCMRKWIRAADQCKVKFIPSKRQYRERENCEILVKVMAQQENLFRVGLKK